MGNSWRSPRLSVVIHIFKALNFELNLRWYVSKASHRKITTFSSLKFSEQSV